MNNAAIPPNWGQLALVAGAVAVFAGGGALSMLRRRVGGKWLDWVGFCAVLAAVVWHSISRGTWLPLHDNFEVLAVLGLLLAGFALYIQCVKPIPGLDWFLIPIVVLMLISAAVFGKMKPDAYQADSAWTPVHLMSTFGGALAFAIAAAVGCMYLIVSARLRQRPALPGPNLGNLERLENVMQWAVTLGFALLTVGMMTGLILENGSHTQLGPRWMTSPKVILALGVWVIYAIALHTPITPAVRGRKSAMLSIVGFVLMFATLVAVQYMPVRH